MPIEDYQAAAQTIAGFITSLTKLGGLRLKFRISAGEGARDPEGLEAREIYVDLSGPDATLLTAHQGELLRSIEHIAVKMLRLEQHEHDLVSFDALGFKQMRASELRLSAQIAAEKVRQNGQPFTFAPMSSHERRMLHLAFRAFEDLETESSGEGARRCLVVYPKGYARPKTAAPEHRRPQAQHRR